MKINQSKIVFLFFIVFGIFTSCDFENMNCSEEIYSNKIPFGKYSSKEYLDINGKQIADVYVDPSSPRYRIYQFSFHEDSSFSYLEIQHQGNSERVFQDTVIMLNGKFKISKDPGLPWYVLELDADYIYEKNIKNKSEGIWYFADFSKNEFEEFKDRFFKNTDKNGCFRLYSKIGMLKPRRSECSYRYEGVYWSIYDMNFITYCPQTNPTGDSL